MDMQPAQFLTTIITIIDKLHASSLDNNQPMLASVLAIAKVEAEDALRHENGLEALVRRRQETSSAHSWRACDRPLPVEATSLEDASAGEAGGPEAAVEKIAA